jgi:hypothetical protein
MDEGDHRIPVVEDLARQRTRLVLDLAPIALAVRLQAGEQPPDGSIAAAGCHLFDEAAQVTSDLAAESGARTVSDSPRQVPRLCG